MLVQIATVTPDIERLIIIVIPQGLAKVATFSSCSSIKILRLICRRLSGANRAISNEVLFRAIRFLVGRSTEKSVTECKTEN